MKRENEKIRDKATKIEKRWKESRKGGTRGEREREERELVENGCNYFPAIRYHLIKYLQQNYIYMMNGMA